MNHETFESMRLPLRCYKYSGGCIHLEYGNAMFTFTKQQFPVRAEVIAETQKRIQTENEPIPDPLEFIGSLVMYRIPTAKPPVGFLGQQDWCCILS